MQTCAQSLAMAAPAHVAQPSARRATVASASCSFGARPQAAFAQGPAARPLGAASLPKRTTLLVAQAAEAALGKLISKVEIPAFIPRTDLMDQLIRWACIEIQENGMGTVGCPCKVSNLSVYEITLIRSHSHSSIHLIAPGDPLHSRGRPVGLHRFIPQGRRHCHRHPRGL
jgi:hypothetical protein